MAKKRKRTDPARKKHDPYDLSVVPKATVEHAEELFGLVRGNTMLCGDTEVVEGWWIETHTLGCRKEAGEPEEDWWNSHWAILEEHEKDGTSRIIVDERSGAFVTMTPPGDPKDEGPKWGTHLVVDGVRIGVTVVSIQEGRETVWMVLRGAQDAPDWGKGDDARAVFDRAIGFESPMDYGGFATAEEAKGAVREAVEKLGARWEGWHKE